MRGNIVINRALRDHPVVGIHNPEWFAAWVWMLMEASWKDRRKSIGGKTVTLKRGQFAASVRFIAGALGWTKDKTHRFLVRLKTETMIATETATGETIVTICNYDKYQLEPGHAATPAATESETAPRQHRDSTATNENTRGNTDEIPDSLPGAQAPPEKPARKQGARLPDDWQPSPDLLVWAAREHTGVNVINETAKFRNYWHSKPGKGATKLDWAKTWQNWIINAGERAPKQRVGSGGFVPMHPGAGG